MQPTDPSLFPHLSAEHRNVLECMAAALGDQAAIDLLASSLAPQLGRLEQLETFSNAQMLQGEQTMQAELQTTANLTVEMLRLAAESREALERVVNVVAGVATSLSSAAATPPSQGARLRAVKIDAPKLDGTEVDNLIQWLLVVERSAKVQLIDNNKQMVSFAISNLRGRASEWAYSTLLAGSEAFETWEIIRTKMKAMYPPPNNEALLQGHFFAMKQGKFSLERYIQEMRSVCAAITTNPLSESVKVPSFLNGLNAGPACQVLYRNLPSMMEDAIRIAFIEQQSFRVSWPEWNSACPNGGLSYHRAVTPGPCYHGGPSRMDLSSVEVTCFNCGRRGHYQSKCPAPRQSPSRAGGQLGKRLVPRGGHAQ